MPLLPLTLLMMILCLQFTSSTGACEVPEPCTCQTTYLDVKYLSREHVNCRKANLSAIPDEISPNATGLDFTLNFLTEVENGVFERKNLVNLRDLNLNQNPLLKLNPDSFRGLYNLKYLYLSAINIVVLDPNQLKYNPQLEKLSLYNNNDISLPTDGPLVHSLSLKNLELGYCSITFLPSSLFSGTPNLEVLVLLGNRIQILPNNLFVGTKNLKHLDLENNNIRILQPETFLPVSKLEKIILEKNRLKTIKFEVFSDKLNLKEVILAENPFNCDCKLYSSWKKLLSHGTSIINASCAEPENQSWDDVFEDLDCDEKTHNGDNRIGSSTQITKPAGADCVVWGDDDC